MSMTGIPPSPLTRKRISIGTSKAFRPAARVEPVQASVCVGKQAIVTVKGYRVYEQRAGLQRRFNGRFPSAISEREDAQAALAVLSRCPR